jgi:hypothetical protein
VRVVSAAGRVAGAKVEVSGAAYGRGPGPWWMGGFKSVNRPCDSSSAAQVARTARIRSRGQKSAPLQMRIVLVSAHKTRRRTFLLQSAATFLLQCYTLWDRKP